jgi:hypothetical protein
MKLVILVYRCKCVLTPSSSSNVMGVLFAESDLYTLRGNRKKLLENNFNKA